MAEAPVRTWPAIDLTRHGDGHGADAFSDRLALLLDDLGPTAVEDREDGRRWRVHFDNRAARDRAVAALRAALGAAVATVPVAVEDEGWAVRVQQDLRAVRVGRVIVAPPWDAAARAGSVAGDAAAIVIVIEPSMGFGTGHHESTRLCLEALHAVPLDGMRVVDVGTGSGVLAIAAACLGARDTVALDHDPDAVAAARDNAIRNGLAAAIDVRQADLGDASIESVPAGEVTIANLTAWALRQHAPALERLARPGGRLIVGGFTRDQVPLVTDSFRAWSVQARYEEDDWVALVLARSHA